MHSKVSTRTFRKFADAVSGFSVVGAIDDNFESAGLPLGIPIGEVSGARRTRFRSYTDQIDQNDPRELLKLCEALSSILSDLEPLETNGTFDALVKALQQDGFRHSEGHLTADRPPLIGFAVSGVEDLDNLRSRLDRLAALVDEHPTEAIGGAKELVESVCKTVLRLSGEPEPRGTADLVELAKAAMKVLDLVPVEVDQSKKGAEIVRRCLQQLGAVVSSLGELRNLYGSGHGKDGKWRGLGPRHARLAVSSATAVAAFLAETFIERRK